MKIFSLALGLMMRSEFACTTKNKYVNDLHLIANNKILQIVTIFLKFFNMQALTIKKTLTF